MSTSYSMCIFLNPFVVPFLDLYFIFMPPNRFISCNICHLLLNYSKYRRHLNVHVTQGYIKAHNVNRILFKTNFTQSVTEKKLDKNTEHKCSLCGSHIPKLLSYHLKQCLKWVNLQEISDNSITRGEEFNVIEFNHNSHGSSQDPIFDCNCAPRNASEVDYLVNNIPKPSHHDSTIANFNSILNANNLKEISDELLSSILDFKHYLSVSGGGRKSQKAIDIDISNLCHIINNVGEDSFWNPYSINKFLTQESKFIAPNMAKSRIKYFRKYIEYLRSLDSKLLPDYSKLALLTSMMDGLLKNIVRQGPIRNKEVMSQNKKVYSHLPNT